MTNERLKQIIRDYVYSDLEATETEYVRDMLIDVCGCSVKELNELGFEFLLDTEE